MNNLKEVENKKESNFYFECARCSYQTSIRNDMIRHLQKKKKCIISNNNNEDLDDVQLYNKSTIKIFKNNENINNKNIINNQNITNNQNNQNIKNIQNNQNNQNNQNIQNNENENKKICEYCDLKLSNNFCLKRHLEKCIKNPKNLSETLKTMDKKNLEETFKIVHNLNNNINNINENFENNKNIPINYENTSDIQNNYNIVNNNIIQQNTQNNLIINLNNDSINVSATDKILIPFFDKFDTSHINDELQMNLLFSNLYIETLREILKNSVNLNFIVKNEDKNGFIYKNEKENIVEIDNIIVYNNVWKKVRDYLLESFEKIKAKKLKIDDEIMTIAFNKINKKYNDFILEKDNNYTKNVIGTIDLISNENYEKTKEGFKNFCNYQIKDI